MLRVVSTFVSSGLSSLMLLAEVDCDVELETVEPPTTHIESRSSSPGTGLVKLVQVMQSTRLKAETIFDPQSV